MMLRVLIFVVATCAICFVLWCGYYQPMWLLIGIVGAAIAAYLAALWKASGKLADRLMKRRK